MKELMERGEKLHSLWCNVLEHARSPLLLAIRLYWGWQFFVTGRGKFQNLDKVTAFFTSLGIPAPRLNVYMAATTETVGGLLLLLGLGGRIATVPLIFTMLVAYGTAHRDSVANIFNDPDTFVTQAPFLFLYAAVLVLVFGPGKFSLDHLIGLSWAKKKQQAKPPAA